jgi:hypothetical protein
MVLAVQPPQQDRRRQMLRSCAVVAHLVAGKQLSGRDLALIGRYHDHTAASNAITVATRRVVVPATPPRPDDGRPGPGRYGTGRLHRRRPGRRRHGPRPGLSARPARAENQRSVQHRHRAPLHPTRASHRDRARQGGRAGRHPVAAPPTPAGKQRRRQRRSRGRPSRRPRSRRPPRRLQGSLPHDTGDRAFCSGSSRQAEERTPRTRPTSKCRTRSRGRLTGSRHCRAVQAGFGDDLNLAISDDPLPTAIMEGDS